MEWRRLQALVQPADSLLARVDAEVAGSQVLVQHPEQAAAALQLEFRLGVVPRVVDGLPRSPCFLLVPARGVGPGPRR